MTHKTFRLSQNFGNLSGNTIYLDSDGWQRPPVCTKHKFGLSILQKWFESKSWSSGKYCPRCTPLEGIESSGYVGVGKGVYFTNSMIKSKLSEYNIKTVHFLAEGADGFVYFLQSIEDPSKNYAMKMCRFTEDFTQNMFITERDISVKMGECLVGPKIYKTWMYANVRIFKPDANEEKDDFEVGDCGFIIMDYLEETLSEYKHSGRNTIKISEIKTEYLRLVKMMMDNGVFNPDFHTNNIMFGKKDDLSTLKFIDWSQAKWRKDVPDSKDYVLSDYDRWFNMFI